ncbi:conserved hypothetical protein [Histoplasma capsulatum G186AR]|uniref:EKC/KEOPS complex subunit BUD32 n=2 Tax=Ajellomyces capsulatus TaxID=5037 RepID=C0NBW3_AJECG|nr:uncharacterized protein HCBG_00609 [Histoplasma capsulatum G186AR]EEH11154.1 conserved hypothetical protein [Histoplasma capsulatum G186AR]KAG5302999.1 hypothetical protein I7I52_00833 [Histoplasma capsulatum]QSS71601.1 hypothetical protein I7I50_02503 [Histoplasma capsulatum G186AR]
MTSFHSRVKRRPGSPTPGWFTRGPDGYNSESLSVYEHGDFCPVLLGDVKGGQDLLQSGNTISFKIVAKLGYGSFSTVWLAKNVKTDEYLALKFLTLKCSTRDNTEMRILKKLGKLRCAFFYKHINNLEYLCLGMDPAGSSLHDRENSEVPLPSSISTITTFISCLVNRVLTLHQLGIHHGDITSKNVVLGLHKDAFTSEALHNSFMCDCNVDIFYIGEEGEAPSLPPNLPKYIVQHEEIGLLTDKEDMSKVDLIDFGLSFEEPTKTKVWGTKYYQAPENEEGRCASAKSDLWSLGCVLLYGLAGENFFEEHDQHDYLNHDDDSQLLMIDDHLSENRCLGKNISFRMLIGDIIHHLLQKDPSKRDPDTVRDLLRKLESGDYGYDSGNSQDGSSDENEI